MWIKEFVFPLTFFIFPCSCLSQWGKTGNLSLETPPPRTPSLLRQSSEGWHSNYAFFKRNCKSSHRATSSWQLNWSGIRLERLRCTPSRADVGNRTSAGRRAVNQVQRRAPSVHLSRGRTGRWGGLRLGGKHGIENKRTLFSFTSILILRQWTLCSGNPGKPTLINVTYLNEKK